MNWRNVRVVVTGAGGFIGSHLTEELARRGAKVRALVHYNSRGHWGFLEDLDPALKRTYSGADKEMSRKLAEALLKPQEAANLMKNVTPEAAPWLNEQTRQRLAQLGGAMSLPAVPYAGAQ